MVDGDGRTLAALAPPSNQHASRPYRKSWTPTSRTNLASLSEARQVQAARSRHPITRQRVSRNKAPAYRTRNQRISFINFQGQFNSTPDKHDHLCLLCAEHFQVCVDLRSLGASGRVHVESETLTYHAYLVMRWQASQGEHRPTSLSKLARVHQTKGKQVLDK
jgi:hypothetical protein